MHRIKYEVHDLGIECPDYFQGFGVAFSKYDDSVVGIGATYNDALEDATEQLAYSGVSSRQLAAIDRMETIDSAINNNISSAETDGEAYYYVGIRYSLVERVAYEL